MSEIDASMSGFDASMSRTDVLISELCPDGVSRKKLKDVTLYGCGRIYAIEVGVHTYVIYTRVVPK